MIVYHGSLMEIQSPNILHSKAFKSVDMYHRGIWDKQRTLQELKYYKKNNQIAIVNDAVLKGVLQFKSSYIVEVK